jgi:hypothetical protein
MHITVSYHMSLDCTARNPEVTTSVVRMPFQLEGGKNETDQSEPLLAISHTISIHRNLMSRLSLQVFYLWRHVLSTAPPFILWWSNLETLIAPLNRSSPFIGGLRYQAIQTEHGRSVYSRNNPKSSLNCEMSISQSHLAWHSGTRVVASMGRP